MTRLESHLRELRASGRKALVVYLMAGQVDNWREHAEAAVAAGADVIEVGIPFSDPMIDGVVIQEAADRALEAGTTLTSVMSTLSARPLGVPTVAMTYFNVFHHHGLERAAGLLESGSISGTIIPDLTLEEAGEWRAVSEKHHLATVFLVAPSTTPDRLAVIAEATEGFCYVSARMAVTGRSGGDSEAPRVVAAVRELSDVPCLVGIGVTTPDQAAEAATVADGVIIGSVVVDQILRGASPDDTATFVSAFRQAIDSVN